MQGGKMDGVHNERAVLDSIPYSRVFYHAFPGAIITHRGQRYKIQSMTSPPAFSDVSNGYKGGTFAAYAKPTSVRYTTRPLSTMKITVVKQITRIDDVERAANDSESMDAYADEGLISQGSLAGNGVVTVCRSVHGYKKLSSITRVELSRTEFCLPSMQFDTFGFWLDTEASVLKSIIKDYDEGVHALSHAILAVAPLFVPSCSSDLNCDHETYDCTRIVIFDMRAGGSGSSAQLFNSIFVPNGILESAIDLMETCSQCRIDHDYEGGCPACLHFGHCLKFNQHLNRKAAILIGKRLLRRVQQTDMYRENAEQRRGRDEIKCEKELEHLSPRRKTRAQALRNAQEVAPTKELDVVMGRTCWAGSSHGRSNGSQVEAD
jgi:DEAD/DEAH box helicase domain-containing protein